MENKKYIELLDRFFQGDISENDNNILKEWIKTAEAKDAVYQYYVQTWHLAPNQMPEDVQNDMLSHILSKIDTQQPVAERKQTLLRKILRVAAVACIVAITGFAAFHIGTQQSNGEKVLISMMNGQKGDIILADGTHVYVNSNSKIKYDGAYNKKNRIVSLQGEAYFEVAKDKNKPFIVEANGMTIEALGTSFNVKAYENDEQVSVVLIEGKVRVMRNKMDEVLKPNQRLTYNVTKNQYDIGELNPNADNLLWRSNELAFYDESLGSICKTLTRMYNWDFIFESERAKTYTYNGIIKNNSLENVLSFISQTTPIRYKILPDQNTIVITDR